MAKKKLNKRFAKILAAVMAVAVIGSAGVVVWSKRKKESPVKYDLAFQAAVQQNNLEDALAAMRKSASLAPTPEKIVTIADLTRRLSLQRPDLLPQLIPLYEQALSLDPNYVPALKGLVGIYADVGQSLMSSKPAWFVKWREYAVRLAKADPTSSEAKAMVPVSTIQGWLKRVDTDPKQLESDIALLAQLVAEDPTNADAFAKLATVYVRQCAEATSGRRPDEAEKTYKALAELTARAVATGDMLVAGGGATTAPAGTGSATAPSMNDQNEAKALKIYYGAASVYEQMTLLDRQQQNQAAATENSARLKKTADKAIALASPTRPLYLELVVMAVRLSGNRTEAERILKDAMEKSPGDQRIRLQYAEFLRSDVSTIDDAIALLAKPIETKDTGGVMAAEQAQQLARLTRYYLNSYRLDRVTLLTGTDNAAKRETLLKDTEADVQKMVTEQPDDATALTLSGRVEVAKQRPVEAITQFSRARSVYERNEQSQSEPYKQLLRYMTDAYQRAGQTGRAKQTLMDLVAKDQATRRDVASRVGYFNILINEGTTESRAEAMRQMNELKAIAPNHPEVKRLESLVSAQQAAIAAAEAAARASAPGADPGAKEAAEKVAIEKYQALPETTKQERMTKANFAAALRNYAEAARLLEASLSEDPSDVNVALNLAKVQEASGKPQDALATLAIARKAKPDDVTLEVYELQLKKASPKEVEAAVLAGYERITNPVQRNLAYYDFYLRTGNAAKAREALKNAEAADPKDVGVNDKLFNLALAEKRLPDAEKHLGVLMAANADNLGGRLYRFNFLKAKGDVETALAVARELTSGFPDFAASWETLAEAQGLTGDLEGARSSYEQVLQRQPKNAKAYKGLAQVNYALKRPKEAGDAIAQGLKQTADADLQEMAIRHEVMFGKTEDALKILENRAANVPTRLDIQAQLGQSYADGARVMAGRGNDAKKVELARKAVEKLKNVIAVLPPAEELAKMSDQQKAITPDSLLLMQALSQAAMLSDAPAAVEDSLKKITAEQPQTTYTAHLLLAQYYAALGKGAEAEAAAREAVKRGGGAVEPRQVAAQLLGNSGKLDEAMAILDGIGDEKLRAASMQLRVELLIRNGKVDAAEKMLKDALAAKPEDPGLNAMMSFLLIHGKRYEDANRIAEGMIRRDPSSSDGLYYRAQAQLMMPGGDVKAAIRDLQVLRDRGNMPVDRRALLVQAYGRDNDLPSVIREQKAIVQSRPDDRIPRLQLLQYLQLERPQPMQEIKTVVEEGLARPSLANDPDLLMARARVAAQEKDAANAEKYGKAALAGAQGSAQMMVTYLNVMLGVDRPQEVLTVTQPFVDAGANEFWIYLKRGEARRKLNDAKAAEADYLKAMDLASRDTSGSLVQQTVDSMVQNLGLDPTLALLGTRLDQAPIYRAATAAVLIGPLQASLRNNETAAAEKYAKQAVSALEPLMGRLNELSTDQQAIVLKQMATLLITGGPQQNYERAAELYRKLLSPNLAPNDLNALNNLAFILSEKVAVPQVAEALKYSTHALEVLRSARPQDPVDPLVYDTHGWIQVLNGQLHEGIGTFRQALLKQSFVEAHYHLGMAYLKLAEQSKGEDRLKIARQAADQADRAQQALARPGTDQDFAPKVSKLMKDAAALISKESGR